VKDVNAGYKLIAIVAVGWSLYSCSNSAESIGPGWSPQGFEQLRSAIAALDGRLNEMNAAIAELQGCSTTAFLNGECSDLPQDASLTTTYCIEQGRGAELSAELAVDLGAEIELGAGWPNVGWGKATGKATIPVGVAVIPLPTSVGGEAATHLGRGLEICAEVPIEPDDDQLALIKDLVRGVNVQHGAGLQAKYRRRADRLLNYAARRTPIAVTNALANVQSKSGHVRAYAMEESDNAFDVAEEAVERFLEGGFQQQLRAGGILADPIFTDLASSLDLPQQVTSMISNPQQVLGRLQNFSTANACANLGVDEAIRAGFPNLASFCNMLAQLPADQNLKNVSQNVSTVLGVVTTVRNSVNSLANRVCGLLGC
jgi:hypothetical protein